MTTLFSIQPNLLISPFPTQTLIPLRYRIPTYPILPKRSSRGSVCVTRVGFQPGPETIEGIRELFGRAEAIVYTVADAAVSSSDTLLDATSTAESVKQKSDWLSGITNSLETILKVLKGGLSSVHVPYSYGFAIILLTVIVKAATFPLTKKQVESANAMRSLQPQIKAIQKRYAGDQEKIQLETARLYKLAGINPLAGCLPTLATIPVWIGLYRALSQVADEGLLTEGFFWIPSLAGPTTVASRQTGSGISWLFPFVDGHPPLGWSDTLAYLVLPMLLVVSQYVSVQIMQSSQSDDPNLKTSQAITKFLPLMIGYFALSVPSGLSLYWLTNNLLSTAQQVWLQKLGGAKSPSVQISDDMIKDSQSKPQKYVTETISTATKAKQEKESTPEGERPGERFRKLKEQEAERRRLREKEKSKAEEVAAKASQLANEEHTRETKLVEKGDEVGFDLVDGGNETVQSISRSHRSSNSDVLNGNLSGRHMQNDQEKDSAKPNAVPTATENKHPSE